MKKIMLTLMIILLMTSVACTKSDQPLDTPPADNNAGNPAESEDQNTDQATDQNTDQTTGDEPAANNSDDNDTTSDDNDTTNEDTTSDAEDNSNNTDNEADSQADSDSEDTDNSSVNDDTDETATELPQALVELIPENYSPLSFTVDGQEKLNEDAVAYGDLNHDGLSDAVLVVESVTSGDFGKARKVLIAYGNQSEGYDLAVTSDSAVLESGSGGIWGDPFEGITLDTENSEIQINHYGGSNWRWYDIANYRLLEDKWQLIHLTKGEYFTGDQTMDNADETKYDYIEGTITHVTHDEAGNPVETTEQMETNEPQFIDSPIAL